MDSVVENVLSESQAFMYMEHITKDVFQAGVLLSSTSLNVPAGLRREMEVVRKRSVASL